MLTDLANIAQIVQVIIAVVVFIYAIVIAKDLRESIKARHLDGMKYVRDLIGTQEGANKRKWVYEELENAPKPLSRQDADKVRAICRDFDTIGLLCRKGLLPTEIIIETYNRNITEMWTRLKPSIDELRKSANDDDYFVEFDWLAHQAAQVQRPLSKMLSKR